MGKNIVETLMGMVVLLTAGLFLGFAYMNNQTVPAGDIFKARFDRADGLNVGSPVRLSGVQVGSVTKQDIDPQTFLAVISFSVKSGLHLPADTSAEIVSDGFLGGKYLALVPGGAEENLKQGDYIRHTQSSISMESLIRRMMFSSKESSDK